MILEVDERQNIYIFSWYWCWYWVEAMIDKKEDKENFDGTNFERWKV